MHVVQERRVAERWWFHRSALAIIPGSRGRHSCGIRDLSRQGAGLRLDGIVLLTTDFKLSLDGVRHIFICRLVWRDADFAGVKFQPIGDR